MTTSFQPSAKTIADICKSRWQVELVFKWIKQNLKVKSFVGTSRNAAVTQLWIALCMYLLAPYLKFANRLRWSLAEILRLLQLNLFERQPLDDLLGNKALDPPAPDGDEVRVELVGQQCILMAFSKSPKLATVSSVLIVLAPQ